MVKGHPAGVLPLFFYSLIFVLNKIFFLQFVVSFVCFVISGQYYSSSVKGYKKYELQGRRGF